MDEDGSMHLFMGLSYPKTCCLLHARPSTIIGTPACKATQKGHIYAGARVSVGDNIPDDTSPRKPCTESHVEPVLEVPQR
jgi:hypothetical protein